MKTRHYQYVIKEVPLAMHTAGAYSAGAAIGGSGLSSAIHTLQLAEVSISAILDRAILVDANNQAANITLYLFDQLPTTVLDNVAWAPSFADQKKIVGTVNFATYTVLNSIARCIKSGQGMESGSEVGWNLPAGKIYTIFTTSGTPTWTVATNLYARLAFLVDR